MFRNDLKITLRKMNRQKAFSLINISGLMAGITACLLILLWVRDELGYDRFHTDADSIHRILIYEENSTWTRGPIPLGPALKKDFPEVEQACRYDITSDLITRNDQNYEERGAFADPSFLRIFSFSLAAGDPATALESPDSIVLSETLAKKIYGGESPIGKILKLNQTSDFRVSAVIKDLPKNTLFRFDYLIPFEVLRRIDGDPENFGRFQIFTYVLLNRESHRAETESKISGYLQQKNVRGNPRLGLQPLNRIHLHASDGKGNIQYVRIFSLIAVFILLIACVNYMNLMTAQSSTRTKEIGLRKVTGASRHELIRQFMSESVFFSLISTILGGILTIILLPAFNNLAGKSLRPSSILNPGILLGMPAIAVFAGILSGSYPALFLSSLRPSRILNKNLIGTSRPGNTALRKILIIFQFSTAIFLLISTLSVSRQLHYIRNRNLGYQRDHIITMPIKGNMSAQYEAIKNALLQNPNILEVAGMDQLPIRIGRNYNNWAWEGKEDRQEISMGLTSVDFNTLDTLGMEIVMGRNFSRDFGSDEGFAYILNQTAVQLTELESPVGKKFAAPTRSGLQWGEIIGVVKDFNFQSLRNEIGPMVMMIEPSRFQYLNLRLAPDIQDMSVVTTHLKNVWDRFAPGFPFSFRFMDELYNGMYLAEQRTGKIFRVFTFLALFISCLGLFGLAVQLSEQRSKEIGIRKIMGASTPEIIVLLSRRFFLWVVPANILSWPLAYFFMKNWLNQFAYRSGIKFWIFLLSGVIAVGIALLTVSLQSLKTAMANPVDSLRCE